MRVRLMFPVVFSVFCAVSVLALNPLAIAVESESAMSSKLTPLQLYVTKLKGTEPAFRNEYWDHKEPGLYVDVISGVPLFSSLDKFDSGTGWPSFTRPLAEESIHSYTDSSFSMNRTGLSGTGSGAHLGHVFEDGPADRGGLRYCINSASLRFVHKDRLEQEGYGAYRHLFED